MKQWYWASQMSAFDNYIVSTSRSTSSALNDSELENSDKKSDRDTPEIFMELEDTYFGSDPIADDESKDVSEYSIDESQNDVDSKASLIEALQIASPSNTVNPLKRNVSSGTDELREPQTSRGTTTENCQHKKVKMDTIDLLFSSYANTLKTFSGKRQAIAKLKIAEVMMQQEIMHFEELEDSTKEHDANKS